MPSLTVNVYQNLLRFRRLWSWKQICALTLNMNDSCSRWELGLLTSSAAVHLWKIMPLMMFWAIQTLCEWQIHWTFPLSLSYFCLLTLPSFWLCLCTYSRLFCMHFLYHWCKMLNVFCQLSEISERQCEPWIWKQKILSCWVKLSSLCLISQRSVSHLCILIR